MSRFNRARRAHVLRCLDAQIARESAAPQLRAVEFGSVVYALYGSPSAALLVLAAHLTRGRPIGRGLRLAAEAAMAGAMAGAAAVQTLAKYQGETPDAWKAPPVTLGTRTDCR